MSFSLEEFEARRQEYANKPAKLNPADNISISEQFSTYDAMEYEQKNSPYNQEWKALTAFGNGIKAIGKGVLKGITMLQDINTQAHREDNPDFELNPIAQAVREASDSDVLKETKVASATGLGQFGLDLASGVGQLVPSLAVAPFLGPGGSALLMGASVAGNEYDELREKGVDIDTASEAALINAGIQTPLEFIGFSKLFGKLPVGSVTKGFIKEFAERVATEGVTEFLQEYPEQITKIWAENADKSPDEILGIVKDKFGSMTADAAYSGVIGAIIGGGVAGTHMAINRDSWQNRIERNIHEGKMDIVERQIANIVETNTNPMAAADVIDANQQQSVYVDADTIVNYAQEHGVAIDDLAQSLGVETQAIKNAATEGDYIDISLGRYEAASAKHNGFFQAVKDDTAFEDGGYTVNNDKLRQEAMAKAKEEAKTMDKSVAEALQVEKDSLLTNMLTSGMSRTQANLAMELLTARAKVVNPENPAEALKTLRFQMGDNTYGMNQENQAFKEWFGNSKFVDAEGKPRVAYHGTATEGIEIFDRKKAQDKTGRKMGFGWGKGKFYLSTTEMGAQNAASGAQARGDGKTPTVMPVHLRTEKPITAQEYNERFKQLSGGRDISGTSYDAEYTQAMRDKLIAKLDKALQKEGYDSILDEENGAVAVFDSNQIKSVDNQGTFSREDSNIYKQIGSQIEEVRTQYNGTNQWMKAPNGKKTNLTENQWLMVRTPAFKEWFGDWEAAAKKDIIRNGETVKLDIDKDLYAKLPLNLIKRYLKGDKQSKSEIAKALRAHIPHEVDDTPVGTIKISNNSISDTLHHSNGIGIVATLPIIDNLLQNSIEVGTRYIENKKTSHILATPLEANGKYAGTRFVVLMVVNEDTNGIKFYDHEFTTIKKLDEMPAVAHRNVKHTEVGQAHQAITDIINEDVWSVNENNVSKNVDENGEPLVTYHGTPLSREQTKNVRKEHIEGFGDITKVNPPFDTFKGGNYNDLMFFTADRTHARNVADQRSMKLPDDENGNEIWTEEGYVYDVFINAKKPFIVGDNQETREVLDSLKEIKQYNFYGFTDAEEISKEEALEILKGNNSWMVAEQKEFLDAVKKLGYDSVKAHDESAEYIAVFDPNQIKSAIGNNGSFSTQDNNIYKQTAPEINSWERESRKKLKADINSWKEALGKVPCKMFRRGSKNYDTMIKVMDTPLVLQMTGIPALPMYIKQGKVNLIRLKTHPEMTDAVIEQLPGAMTDPLAVVHSKTRAESIVEILSLKDADGVNVVVPVEINTSNGAIDINLVSSAYGKGNKGKLKAQWFEDCFSDANNVLYLNNKKAQALTSLKVQFLGRDVNGLSLFDTPNILHEEDLVKAKFENPQLYQDNAQVKGSFNPTMQDGQYVISLFKGADASTVIHETGHYFVETMWQSIVDGQASQQVQKDFDTLLDYAGMTREQWAAADVEGRRGAHERLAEAFETYIMEGKAPSEQLKQAFKKFADWLKDVYKAISRSGNAVPLTDDVRSVFDRMLAAEEDIAEAERVNRYFANLPKVITDNMSDATKARVESFIEKARDKAVSVLTKDAMANFRDERKAEVEAYRTEILPEVEAEVAERRVYKNGCTKADVQKYRKLVQNDSGRELTADEQMFVMQFELTAESYGYSSASEMEQDIANSPTQKQAVTRAANEKVNARFPDVMTDQKAHEEAVREALYNDDTGLLIGVEQQLIEEYANKAMESQKKREAAQQSGEKKTTAIDKTKEDMRVRAAAFRQASRNMAREAIYKLTIDDAVRTQKYATLERKAAMKSAEAMVKKDYSEALTQKNLQAYYHAMVQESILAKRLVDKNRRYLKRQVSAKREAWVSDYHFAEASMLFARMGIAQKKHDAYGRVGSSLQEYADAMNEQYDCAEFADWLLNLPDTEPLSDTKMFTLDQFNDLTNAIRNIRAIAKAEKGEKMFEKAESFDALKENIIKNISELPEVFKPNPNSPTQATLFEKMKAAMENIDTFFERMDNWKFGFFSDTFSRRIKHSNDIEFTFKQKFDTAVVEANTAWLPDKDAKKAAAQETYYEELGTSVNKFILTKLLMNLGNKENAIRLCETVPIGFEKGSIWVTPENSTLTREQARELTHQNLLEFLGRVLDEHDVAYAQRMVNAAGLFWSEKNEMEKRVKGFGLKKVEATPQILNINGKEVVFQGGYFPLMRNGEMGSHPVSKEVGDDDPLQGKNIRTLHTNTGSTKSRMAGAKYPVNLFPGAEMQVIYDSIHDLCWRETMNDFRRVLNDGEIFAALKTHLGPARMRVFREMLEKAAQPSNTHSADFMEQTFGQVASIVRNKTANAIIMMNLKVNMQNLGNLTIYGNSVEGFTHADTIAALGNYKMNFADAEGYSNLTEFIFSKSPFMRERMEIPDISVRDVQEDVAHKQTEFEKQVMRVGTKMMAFSDGLTAKPVWLQAYQKALNNGKPEQEAVDYADMLIRRTLGSSRVTDVSSLQRGGAIFKLMTMFQSFFNTQYNQWVREYGKDKRLISEGKKREAYESAFSFFLAKYVLTCLASAALAMKNPFGTDDDDGWLEILKEMKNYTFSMFGPVGQVGSYIVGTLLGMKEYGYKMSVAQSAIEKGAKVAKTIKSDKATKADVVESVTDVAGLVLGVPAQANRMFWNLYDIIVNDMKPRLEDLTTRRSKKKRDE